MTQWYISARSNSTLLLVDTAIEQTFESLSITKRFNDVGTWVLQLRKEDAHYSTFAPVSGVLPDVGLLVYVDNEDGNGLQLVMSGPLLDVDVKSQQDSTQPVLITGACDNYYLSKRRAFQVPHYPYLFYISGSGGNNSGLAGAPESGWYAIDSGAMSFALQRYYPLTETSGTTATDWSLGVTNGTYNGGFTLNQPGLIDDPTGCVLLNGSTGYINVPTTSLPTGNSAWAVWGWCMRSTTPGANEVFIALGSVATKQGANIGCDSSGFPYIGVSNVAQSAGTAKIPLNTPVFLAMTWDGTTLAGYMNGTLFASQMPGALTMTYGSVFVGKWLASTNFWNGYVGHFGFSQGILSAATQAQINAVGVSRLAYQSYDDNGGFWSYPGGPSPTLGQQGVAFTHASTAMIYYLQRNAASTASPVSSYGTAAPTTAFTNAIGTHSARVIPNLSIASDPSAGSAVYVPARMDVLLDLFGAIALQSSPELGFKLEQSGTNLVFTIFAPSDLTGTAIFSRDLYGAKGNILEYEWKLSVAIATHVIVGGSNPNAGAGTNLESRLWGEGENSAGISNSGYLEEFVDYRQGGNNTSLTQAIAGQLAADASVLNVNATLIDQPGVLYFKGPSGKGYDLGNKVTVLVDNQTFQQLIRQIQIDLQPNKPAVITPAIGTPVRAEIISEYDTLLQRITSLQSSNATLKANY